jgi:hypothetical protein
VGWPAGWCERQVLSAVATGAQECDHPVARSGQRSDRRSSSGAVHVVGGRAVKVRGGQGSWAGMPGLIGSRRVPGGSRSGSRAVRCLTCGKAFSLLSGTQKSGMRESVRAVLSGWRSRRGQVGWGRRAPAAVLSVRKCKWPGQSAGPFLCCPPCSQDEHQVVWFVDLEGDEPSTVSERQESGGPPGRFNG